MARRLLHASPGLLSSLTYVTSPSPPYHVSPPPLPTMQLPIVCEYQYVEYVVVLMETMSDLVIMKGPHTLLYGSHHNISVKIDDDRLRIGQIFNISTNFTLLGLEQDARSLQEIKKG